MRSVAVVQARMGSSRLPGKVLADVAGKPMLVQLLGRLARSRGLDEILVATTEESRDDDVETVSRDCGFRVVRGSTNDVLDRYVRAQQAAGADLVVRITADCPLVDPAIVDKVIATLKPAPDADYASNVEPRTYPQGLDVEAFTAVALQRMEQLARSEEDREHVTWVVRVTRPDAFEILSVVDEEDNSDLRWTVDTPADLALIRRLYAELELTKSPLGYREILAHVRANPELARMNTVPPRPATDHLRRVRRQ